MGRFISIFLAATTVMWPQIHAFLHPLVKTSSPQNLLQLGSRQKLCVSHSRKLWVMTSRNDDSNLVEVGGGGQQPKGLAALWAKYGPLYFIVWFTIYLPFLLIFFYVIDNDIMNASQYGIDPPSALNSLVDNFEKLTHNHELLADIRGSKHVANFAAAYLCADLVPTTVFALAAVGYITTRNGTNDGGNSMQ